MKKALALLMALVCLLSLAALAACKPADADADPTPTEPVTADPAAPPETTPDPDGDLAYILAAGQLTVGITEYEPMNYYDETGTLVGFDTEFALAVCAKLGVTPKFQVIDWDSKEIELKSQTIDCIWNGLTVDDDRRLNMDFSVSYLRNRQVVVVRAADEARFTDIESFDGVAVVAEQGSAGEGAAQSDLANTAYTAVSSQAAALLEVKSGTADAAVIDFTMARAMTGEGTDYADLLFLDLNLTPEEYAIGFRLGSDATARVNAAVSELIADGTLAALAAKYDLSDLLI
ncbi:MAG: transporter substrate-binding domain-containing protein [Oscillospiraceae bacterium]|jgi:polar amino acid transport system substrate-binding protein|nr:transporter substrate-binding domain-containing protein [Oscillospiraceae bacterium]